MKIKTAVLIIIMVLINTGTTGQTESEYGVKPSSSTFPAIFTQFSFAHHINPTESIILLFSRAILQNSRTIPGQMALHVFSNSISFPGPKSNSRTFQGLCEPCTIYAWSRIKQN